VWKNGAITVQCEFCSTAYKFDPSRIPALRREQCIRTLQYDKTLICHVSVYYVTSLKLQRRLKQCSTGPTSLWTSL
jgi:hypothetical protein